MMDGIILAALALLSVPVLLIVILVKVCGLENKVADLAKRIGVNNLTQKHVTAAQAGLAIRGEPSRAERVPRDMENIVSASPRDNSSVSADLTQSHRDTEEKVAVKVSAAKENVEKPLSNSNSLTPTSSPSVPRSPFPVPRSPTYLRADGA